MITTAKKAGVYKHQYYSQTHDLISIITVKDIIENKQRLNVKLGLEDIKSAEKITHTKLAQLIMNLPEI